MELWYTEEQTSSLRFSCKVKETLATAQTPYQHLAIIDTEAFGPMLVLDGMVMTTIADEFVYHEMISHPALFTHPCPRKVAVIGGGDGGAIREVLKHPQVEKAILAEIDGEVIAQSRKFLPEISKNFRKFSKILPPFFFGREISGNFAKLSETGVFRKLHEFRQK